MFEKFGEFDSVEELNRAAEAQRAEGDEKALVLLAEENGLDKEDAEDFMDGCIPVLATPLMAATGKIRVESESLGLKGVLTGGIRCWICARRMKRCRQRSGERERACVNAWRR